MSEPRLDWVRRFPPDPPAGVVVPLSRPGLWTAVRRAVAGGRLLALDRSAQHLVVRTLDSDPPPWIDGGRFVAPDAQAARLWLPTHRRPLAPPVHLWAAVAARGGGALSSAPGVVLLPGDPLLVLPLGPSWPVTLEDLP